MMRPSSSVMTASSRTVMIIVGLLKILVTSDESLRSSADTASPRLSPRRIRTPSFCHDATSLVQEHAQTCNMYKSACYINFYVSYHTTLWRYQWDNSSGDERSRKGLTSAQPSCATTCGRIFVIEMGRSSAEEFGQMFGSVLLGNM